MIKILNRYWKIFTFVNFIIITFLSLYPLPELPNEMGSDKIHHLIAFCSLTFSIAIVQPAHFKKLILFFITYGGFIELIQSYFNRYGEFIDFVYNTTGIFISLIIGYLFNKYHKKNFANQDISTMFNFKR